MPAYPGNITAVETPYRFKKSSTRGACRRSSTNFFSRGDWGESHSCNRSSRGDSFHGASHISFGTAPRTCAVRYPRCATRFGLPARVVSTTANPFHSLIQMNFEIDLWCASRHFRPPEIENDATRTTESRYVGLKWAERPNGE